MDKIKVIIPSWSYWKNPLKLQPLWELHYATWLRKNFSNFKIIVEDLRDKEKNFIPTGANIYFFWLMKAADSQEVYSICNGIKKNEPDSYIIIGGTTLIICPRNSL